MAKHMKESLASLVVITLQKQLSLARKVLTSLRAHLDQVLHTVVLPGLTRLNSEGARLNR